MSRAAVTQSILLTAALCVFCFCSAERSFCDEAKGAPQLTLKQQIHDFRNVLEGEILTHTFEFVNQGDQPLRIEQVKPDCSCTVADFDPLIPGGGEGRITVRIDTKGFDGAERWAVKIYSNDPKWNVAVLDLRAHVKPVFTLSGTAVVFTGKKNTGMTRDIEIATGLDRPLILTPAQFTLSGKVNYSIAEVEKEKRYKVTFQNVAGKRENYRGFLKLKTNFPEKPEVTLWIVGRFDN